MSRPGYVKRKTALLIAGGVGGVALLAFGIAVERLVREVRHPEIAATAPPKPVAPSAAETKVDSARSPEKDTSSSKRTSMLEEPAQQAAAQFRVKRILKLNGPFKHGEYLWDDA
ncbi:MAG: hypothetical protein AB7U35_15470, partial [Sphingobium sp.]